MQGWHVPESEQVIAYIGGRVTQLVEFYKGGAHSFSTKRAKYVYLAMCIWTKFCVVPEKDSGAVIETGSLYLEPSARKASTTHRDISGAK